MKKTIILFGWVLLITVCSKTDAKSQVKQKNIFIDSTIYSSFKYLPDTDMHVIFGKCGVNKTFNIKSIYLSKNKKEVSGYVSRRSKCLMKSNTDWLGPYCMKSLNDDDDVGKRGFTGGWHGSNGNGTGNPTAKTISVSVTVGGKKVKKNKIYSGDVEITAVNLIQAYNTVESGKYVLKEVVKYKVTPKKIYVSVESTALEDVMVLKYYGLQTQNKPWSDTVKYSNGITATVNEYSDSGPQKENAASSFSIISKNKKHTLIARINSNYGLGKFKYLPEGMPTIFTESYGKTYFNLVNDGDMQVLKNESFGWKGSYEFK